MKDVTQEIEFSIDGYARLIRRILSSGYTASSFRSPLRREPQILLRHDIDFSLESALLVAKVENDIGVRSTYYVLVCSEFYNIFTRRAHCILSEIVELGHEIGLHFDSSRYDDCFERIDNLVNYECAVLENVVSREITSISFHRPDIYFRGLDRQIGGREHTYHPIFFKDIAYISDSGGSFKYGCPLDHPAFLARKSIQLLTHPIWWPPAPVVDNMQLVINFLKDRERLLNHQAALNCRPYSDFCKK
jgi:hypothetical protein